MSQQCEIFEKPLEILPNRWITLDEQKEWCEFLGKLSLNEPKLEWCATEYEKYQCSVTQSHVKKVRYLLCGKRGLCPRCSMNYARKKAGTSRPKSKSTVSAKSYANMKAGFPKKKKTLPILFASVLGWSFLLTLIWI